MDDLYKNIYKIESTRLTNWNYSKPAYYFLTICTNKRKIFFGQIINQKMILNDIGKNVEQIWRELPNHFPNILLDEFIIMPNHLHGIILIQSPEKNFDYFFDGNIPGTYNENAYVCRDAIHRVSGNTINNFCRDAIHRVSENEDAINGVSTGGATNIHNPMGKKTIGEIIRWFKGRSTFEINKKYYHLHLSWQPRFYDHVVRDIKSLIAIRNYILSNPYNWPRDHNNPKNFNSII